jgi:single-strand DNA-binding protein
MLSFFLFFLLKTIFSQQLKTNNMEIAGRITKNAEIRSIEGGKEVVSFSVVVNDSYKAKGSGLITKTATFFDCGYWLGTNIAQYLTKGTIVQLSGSVSAKAWKDDEGKIRAGLNFHVDKIKLLGGGKKEDETVTEPPTENEPPTAVDDLPF